MERAGRTLARLKLSDKISSEELACAAWPVAIGPRIASHATAIGLVRGNLVVECDDSVWQRHLFHLKPQILRKIYEVLDTSTVTDVEFRVAGPRRRPPQIADTRVTAIPGQTDEADSIADAGLRIIYRQSKKRAAG